MKHRVVILALGCLWSLQGISVMAEQLPATAQLNDSRDGLAVYINPEPGEKSSVWVVNQETGDAEKVCVTNPESPVLWQQMNGAESDAVEVSLDNIAAAETAWFFPGDTPRIIVEGCHGYRNSDVINAKKTGEPIGWIVFSCPGIYVQCREVSFNSLSRA